MQVSYNFLPLLLFIRLRSQTNTYLLVFIFNGQEKNLQCRRTQTTINANNKSKRIYLLLKAAYLTTYNDKQSVITLHVFLTTLLYFTFRKRLRQVFGGDYITRYKNISCSRGRTYERERERETTTVVDSSFLLFVQVSDARLRKQQAKRTTLNRRKMTPYTPTWSYYSRNSRSGVARFCWTENKRAADFIKISRKQRTQVYWLKII